MSTFDAATDIYVIATYYQSNALVGQAHALLAMIRAQFFPFVALLFYEGGKDTTKDALMLFLVGSMGLWLLLNIAFFFTIDLSYLGTFFGTVSGPQYLCELFLTSETELAKFDMVFDILQEQNQLHEEHT